MSLPCGKACGGQPRIPVPKGVLLPSAEWKNGSGVHTGSYARGRCIEFYARKTRCNHGVDADFGLEHLSCLTHFIVKIQCWDATAAEVESFDSAIKHAVKTHPNLPMLQIIKTSANYMTEENENLEDNRV